MKQRLIAFDFVHFGKILSIERNWPIKEVAEEHLHLLPYHCGLHF